MNHLEIRQRREALGLTPEQFAARLGISHKEARSTVWRWENGKRNPSPQTIMLIKQLKVRRNKQ